MGDVKNILQVRTVKGAPSSKMREMAQQSATGQLSGFSGVFGVIDLSDQERGYIAGILDQYEEGNRDEGDLGSLLSITSEIKAIQNQSILLHGERIKRAQQILIRYREGAFTAWLLATYGNRQTPYNLLQYYEFWEAMPRQLRPKIEAMPRQAIYVLAGRTGPLEKKQGIVENYRGEKKEEMLTLIRREFPLDEGDRRAPKHSIQLLSLLKKAHAILSAEGAKLSLSEKKQIRLVLKQLEQTL